MKSSDRGFTNRTYLPTSFTNDTCSDSGSFNCFEAGEYRTSENLGLVTMQTLFNRLKFQRFLIYNSVINYKHNLLIENIIELLLNLQK